jgi:hypothetical protein
MNGRGGEGDIGGRRFSMSASSSRSHLSLSGVPTAIAPTGTFLTGPPVGEMTESGDRIR